ncbi:hypothetical protein BV22DRAFT_1007825 [Leucogyrophana mollusca]|uniref:Uncharacterized protein n=1 Tax=Leucogyrophana mollusca TaxID=85980 RepID=A0ACB8BME8_9AGAM|nr:hypothetical protein BV22DRAFT_1007825 [Leucogyrophana mollusca]
MFKRRFSKASNDDARNSLPQLPTAPESQSSLRASFSRLHIWQISVIIAQVFVLTFGWGFLAAVLYYKYIALPDRIADLVHRFPSELTLVTTLIATMLSVATAFLFTAAVKDALRHRMSQPISLITLTAGIALTKGTHIWKPRHLRLTALTWLIFAVLTSLTAGWTTLLAPTLINMEIGMSGTELDVAGDAFSDLLGQELAGAAVESESCLFHDNSFEIIDIGGILSGVAAAGINFGLPGTFNFNGAKYNLSTGGIVPAIASYAGSYETPDQTRLSFSGGQVPVNTVPDGGRFEQSIPPGFSRNYTMYQQGLSANVSCESRDLSGDSATQQLSLSNPYLSIPVHANDSSILFYLRQWNSTANCSGSSPTIQRYVTETNSSDQPNVSGSGFLPSVVCPGTNSSAYQRFVVVSQGFYKYSFLPPTVCEVIPLLTNVSVQYSGGLINVAQVINSREFETDNVNLLSFIAGVISWQGRNAQGLVGNSIGDSLFSIYSATANTTISVNNTTQVYSELEDYWRGVVEFTATFLRSGFSARGSFPQNQIPSNMTTNITGTMQVLTVGWARRGPTYLLAVIPITIVAALTFAAVAYSLRGRIKHDHAVASFDISDTIHLVMASSAGGLALDGFAGDGLPKNEATMVCLQEMADERLGLVHSKEDQDT